MISRRARPEETPALQALWARVFGDGAEVTEPFFRHFPPARHTRVIEADGGLAAMGSWLPVTLRGLRGAYIYAVATAPEHRGRGLAHALLQALEASLPGLDFAALCPAEASLYAFYGSQGYETAFWCSRFSALPEGEAPELTELDPAGYRLAREARLPADSCRWDDGALSYLADTGTRFYCFPDGCCAASALPDGRLRVPELLAPDAHAAAAGLCKALGASEAEVFAPGIEQPRGMIKWFTFGQKIPRAYLGFALD